MGEICADKFARGEGTSGATTLEVQSERSKCFLSTQDPHGGLGPLIPGWQPPPPVAAAPGIGPEWAEYSSAAASTVGEFDADEFSILEGTSEASGMQRLPDFKSMLETALRGDVVSLHVFPEVRHTRSCTCAALKTQRLFSMAEAHEIFREPSP